jgi:hypothetical protein
MEARAHSRTGLLLDKSYIDAQYNVTGILPLHEVEDLACVIAHGMQKKARKYEHLFQNTCSEAQPIQGSKQVPRGAFEFATDERLGSVEIFVILYSKQDKIRLVEEAHDEQEYLVAVVELEKGVSLVESTLVGRGSTQSGSKHESNILATTLDQNVSAGLKGIHMDV